MPKIKLFFPGENLSTLGLNKKNKKLLHNCLKLRFPSRIHMTVFDCNRFEFGKPGGGGIGFAVDIPNTIEIELAEKDTIIAPWDKLPLVEHCLLLMKNIFNKNLKLKCKINLFKLVREHSGLGSTTAVITSIIESINLLYGSPIKSEDIRILVAENFAEVFENKLCKGLETGVGTYVILNGGIAIIGDKLKIIYSAKFLPTYSVALIDPKTNRPAFEGSEDFNMLEESRSEDNLFKYQKAFITIMDLIPALYDNDIHKIGKIIWRFQFSGTNLTMLQYYDCLGSKLYKVMCSLKNSGIPIVGFSSVGPTVYAISEKPEIIKRICKDMSLGYYITKIDNKGIINQ